MLLLTKLMSIALLITLTYIHSKLLEALKMVQLLENLKTIQKRPSTKTFCKIFLWSTYLFLMVGVGFFVQEVYDEYFAKSTSIKSYVEIQDLMVPPTIMICFNPVVKNSVLLKYNMNLVDFIGFGNTETNLSMYDEGLYKIGRDFNITIIWNEHHIVVTNETNANNSFVSVEEIYTFYNGRCYKITPNFKVKAMNAFMTKIEMDQSIEPIDLQFVNLHFTSEENSLGIIQGQWLEGKHSLSLEAKLNKSVGFEVYPELHKLKKLKLTNNCHPKINTTKCMINK